MATTDAPATGLTHRQPPREGGVHGALAVAALRGSKLLLMTLGADGAVTQVSVPAQLDDTFGRLRCARLGPDGALYITSSNGTDDVVLRAEPV